MSHGSAISMRSASRVGGEFGEDRRIGGKARPARDDGARSKRKPSIPQCARNGAGHRASAAHRRIGEIERVAAAGVVDQLPSGAGIGAGRARAGQHVPPCTSLSPEWLNTRSRITPIPASCSAATVSRSSATPPGHRPRIERHHRHRVVAPGLAGPSGGRWRSSIQATIGISSTA
jgi:hypothetical protein